MFLIVLTMKNYLRNKEYSLKNHEKHHPLESMCVQSKTLSSECPDVAMLLKLFSILFQIAS